MNRTVKAVGGVLTAVAVLLVLGFAYLSPGSSSPTAIPSDNTSAPAPTSTPRTLPLPSSADGLAWVHLSDLPREAQQTVALIDSGGPFPYDKDGSTFHNFEGILPAQPRGYYREYTVRTPGESDRGARRIVTGDNDRELFYTADHYESFVRVRR